MKITLKQIRM